MIEDGTLDAQDIAEELTTYAVTHLKLELNKGGSSLDDRISLRDRQVLFVDMKEEQVELGHKKTREEKMYCTRQIASRFYPATGNAPQFNIICEKEAPPRRVPDLNESKPHIRSPHTIGFV